MLQAAMMLVFTSIGLAQDLPVTSPGKVLQVFDWKELTGAVTNGQIVSLDGMDVLKITNAAGTPLVITLLEITNATLMEKAGTFICEIKYEDVEEGLSKQTLSNGIPTMGWTVGYRGGEMKLAEYFPPQALGGDDEKSTSENLFSGSSNWTPLTVRAFHKLGGMPPKKLQLELYLQAAGTVYLRPIKLLGIPGSSNWWTSQQAGLIGGIGGSLIGCLGAMTGILGSKGRARGLVLATVKVCIALGLILLAGGMTALVLKQPYAVYYPLLLGGFILTIVFSVNLPSIQRRYDELEIRRMTSEDALRS
ncbi:MAG TPA: hypothetical protein VK742_17230 [Candidatus Sulfotelmatobacter sp.]|nr:hypothetical protein [Candidatus Sulfotelmatobacter sp.]